MRRKRLLSLAAEKFVSDIAADAFQYARIRTNAGPGGRPKAPAPSAPGASGAQGNAAAGSARVSSHDSFARSQPFVRLSHFLIGNCPLPPPPFLSHRTAPAPCSPWMTLVPHWANTALMRAALSITASSKASHCSVAREPRLRDLLFPRFASHIVH